MTGELIPYTELDKAPLRGELQTGKDIYQEFNFRYHDLKQWEKVKIMIRWDGWEIIKHYVDYCCDNVYYLLRKDA